MRQSLQAKQAATLRDVARAAGVSYQTVWRVVKGHPHVAENTRRRVREVLEQLDYRPHRAAQVLTTGRSGMLQLVVFKGMYGAPPLSTLVHAAYVHGYTMMVTELERPGSIEAMRDALRASSRIVDGMLMVLPYPYIPYEMLGDLCQGRPFVVIGTEVGAHIPSVVIDQAYGMELLCHHLLSLGHRAIAEISGPLMNFDARARHEALCEQLAGAGLSLWMSMEGNFDVASGYRAAKRLLASSRTFTALVVGNDAMALGALRALHEAGLRVPENVSVVGFDDRPESAYFEPPLTTVRQDFDALAQESVAYLASMVEDAHVSWEQQRVLDPELVVRQSTGSVIAA